MPPQQPPNDNPTSSPLEPKALTSHSPKLLIRLGVTLCIVLAIILGGYAFWKRSNPVQQETEPVKIGIIQNVQLLDGVVNGFMSGLSELGYVEGNNVTYAYTNVNGNIDQAKEVAREYAAQDVDLLLVITSTIVPPVWEELQKIGKDIPIVFTNGAAFLNDRSFIESLKSSGKNMTGVIPDDFDVSLKKAEFLKRIQPDAKRFAVFYGNLGATGPIIDGLEKVVDNLGLEIVRYKIDATPPESPPVLQQVVDGIQEGDFDAIITLPDTAVNYRDNPLKLVELGNRIGAPVYALNVSIVEQGGFLAYSEDHVATGKQAAAMAQKILTGTPAISIPIEMSGKNLLVINMKVAQELGLIVPESILFNADRVIPAE